VQQLDAGEVLELTAIDASGAELWKWTLPATAPVVTPLAPARSQPRIARHGQRVSAGDFSLEFDLDGRLARMSKRGRDSGLRGPWASIWLRDNRSFKPLTANDRPLKLELAPPGERDIIARARYEGALRSVTWRLADGEIRVSYELTHEGDVDILGIRFDAPEDAVLAKRWLGAGPYRIWKNRASGTFCGLHEVAYNDPVPGETYAYPEFPGFFGAWSWLEIQMHDARVTFRNLTGVPYFGLHRPQPGRQPVIDLPDLGWSFLHVIAPIGSKFTLAQELGPQSQTTRVSGTVRGEIAITVTPP
jgi:hypothetical protein